MWQPLKQYWQKSFSHKVIVVLTTAILMFLVISIIGGYVGSYYFSWVGVGDYNPPSSLKVNAERGKTLWDWLDLLIVPLVLAIGGFLLNRAQRQSEQKIAEDQREQDRDLAEKVREQEREIANNRQEEGALQSYLDAMTTLLLDKGLGDPETGSPDAPKTENQKVSSVARSRTLTVLRGLNETRKASVLRFLYEAKLIGPENTVINLQGADLSEADLHRADLLRADLRGAYLRGANLSWSYLSGANLNYADLRGANLQMANLIGTILFGADLRGADLIGADLQTANLQTANLQRAKYNTEPYKNESGITYRTTHWPDDFDPAAAGAIDVSKTPWAKEEK